MNLLIQQIKNDVLPILKKAGVIRSGIFGSYAREENLTESDIDILVDLPKNSSLFDLVDLQQKLEDVLGRKIDLVTYKSLHPLLKSRILSEQVQIL
jgi:predicted nucleotidyltransferase